MAAVTHAEGIEVLRAEMQKYAAGAAKGGRVVEPVAANVAQSTRSCIVVARGGCSLSRLFREATQLKTVGASVRIIGIEVSSTQS